MVNQVLLRSLGGGERGVCLPKDLLAYAELLDENVEKLVDAQRERELKQGEAAALTGND